MTRDSQAPTAEWRIVSPIVYSPPSMRMQTGTARVEPRRATSPSPQTIQRTSARTGARQSVCRHSANTGLFEDSWLFAKYF